MYDLLFKFPTFVIVPTNQIIMKRICLLSILIISNIILFSQNFCEVSNLINKELHKTNSTREETLLLDSLEGHFFFFSTVDSILMLKKYYDYDVFGLSNTDSSFFLNPTTQEWTYDDKHEFTYNEMFHPESETFFTSDMVNNIWLEESRELNFYDQSDTLLDYQLHEEYLHSSQSWEKEDSIVFLYNQLNNVSEEYTYQWEEVTGEYELLVRNLLVYNNSNLLTSDTTFSYYNGYEEYNFLMTYEYNGNGNRIQSNNYYWVSPQYGFENMEKRIFTYDSEGRLQGSVRYEWVNSYWEVIEEYQYIYNEYNLPRYMIFWETDEPGILEREFTFEFFYSYHTIVEVQETVENAETYIFPNPTSGILSVITNGEYSCILFNQFGHSCLDLKLTPGENYLDLTHFAPGIYYLVSRDGWVSQKVIIR